jgi:hypothetical protein
MKGQDGKTDLQHVYEIRPRKDKRGFDLISDALPDSKDSLSRGFID